MGDFGQGVDQENNMLGEMHQYNSQIKEHHEVRSEYLQNQLASAKEETSKEKDPTKLGEDVTQISQVASKTAEARKVFRSTKYGSDLGAYAKGLGRTGEETDLGLSKAVSVAKKGVSTVKDLVSGGSGVKAAASSLPKSISTLTDVAHAQLPITGRLARGGMDTASAGARARGVAGVDLPKGSVSPYAKPVEPELESESTFVKPTTRIGVTDAGLKSGSEVSSVAEGGEEAESLLSKGSKLASTAGEVVGHVGVGLGILGGATSLAADMSSGHFKLAGDNTAEKTGNALSLAGGTLDTLSLVAPPLAIVGGILDIGSAIAEAIGHIEHSAKKVAAVKKEQAAPPKETAMGVTSLSAIGQVASQGTSMLHTVAGTTAF